MNIYLTYDYELFFGERTGTVDKCIIDQTNSLMRIAEKYNIQVTFFVDVGYLIQLEKWTERFPDLMIDLKKIKDQIQSILQLKSKVQLHIHPHWEKAYYDGEKWVIKTENCYKLFDFTDAEINRIVREYKSYLDTLVSYSTTTFRAGGWCIQPFERLKPIFKELGLKVDTSVFVGGQFESKDYYFDFRNAPAKSSYHFENDVCVEDKIGSFLEVPISSHRYSPLFYWRLYILGRLFPKNHKMLGDGIFLAQPGRKKSVLTSFTWNHASSDGYYASKLNVIKNKLTKHSYENMVVIGHPKSNTHFSIRKLEQFVKKNHKKHSFISFD
jgi:peptidoglycan/xylan/chitin deacetylase (PgdA/CDA1 family)